MSTKEIYIVPEESEYQRLDKVLVEIVPDSGLRLRRRLCDDGRVLVDGKKRKPGYKVRTGQEIVMQGEAERMTYQDLGLAIVKEDGQFAAVYKPGEVHSAGIEGKNDTSVEDVLPEMFPEASPILLNRLDYLTSGLLVVALDEDAEKRYLAMEEAGEIKKFYNATVKGRLDGVVTVKSELDTDNRKKTRILDEEDWDVRRWTDIEVMAHDHENDTTDVRCLIMKGARHQIRAHLASIGHPIVGDPLYGDGQEGETLCLQHQRVDFCSFSASVNT